MIDAFASEQHYADHLVPIWRALQERGTFWACGPVADRLDSAGLDPRASRRPDTDRPVMVASYRDLWTAGAGPHVLVEHGAGQQYGNASPSYSGGHGRETVGLFICPSQTVAARNRAAYASAQAVAVGAPALDAYHGGSPASGGAVAISFHWECTVAPEARSAFRHYRSALMLLAARFGEVIGHGHPRVFEQLRPIYERCGIEPVADFAEVLARAGVYAVDNSSTLYEFASTGRPVVVMNAPWYRRDVEHGLRFWEYADVGVQVDEAEDLPGALELALSDPPAQAARRAEVIEQVYEATDGKAAERAARAIEDWMA